MCEFVQSSHSEVQADDNNEERSDIADDTENFDGDNIVIGEQEELPRKQKFKNLDIEGCHRLPLGRNATNTTKCAIVKFVNRKHSEAMLQRKKDISKKSKMFVSHSLCSYYRFLWGKCK